MSDEPNDPIIDLPPEDVVPRTPPADHDAVIGALRSRLGDRLTFTFPGLPVEDCDGNMIAMTQPTIYSDTFGSLRLHTEENDHGR